MSGIRKALAAVLMACVAVTAQPFVADAADPYPPYIMPDAQWLDAVNYYRAMAGLAPVAEDRTLSPGAYNHSCYMLYNGISHDETPGLRGYTAAGDTAGNNGNVAVSSNYGATSRSHIDLWMTGPFHAIGILRPYLKTVGFGKCALDNQYTTTWHSGATLNVLNGLGPTVHPTNPIVFPGPGTTTALTKFVAESPNPVSLCGWTGGAGLPVIAMMPEDFTKVTSATITGPSGALPTCALWRDSPKLVGSDVTKQTARAILGGDYAVTVLPRAELTNGTYTVSVTTDKRTVRWSFTVNTAAATGIMPLPQVQPLTSPRAFTTVTPFRLADSRLSYRITKVKAGVPKLLKVAGNAGLPADITALSANFTVVNAPGDGYLTVYNCTVSRPTASTVNYYRGEVVANAGLFPLDSKGQLCVYSPRTIDLVIDVSGYFRPTSSLRYEGMDAAPLVDTTRGLRSGGRMSAGQTMRVNVARADVGVPVGASAVAVTITGISPDITAHVTAYPCDVARPTVSNVNPVKGTVKQNFAIVRLPASGDLCLFTATGMHLKVDVMGYFTPGAPHTMVPTTPTRVVDTRDKARPQMNLGLRGYMVPAGVTERVRLAGDRNIPSSASVISANVTVVTPSASGSITLWDCGTQPAVKSVNFRVGRNVANGLQLQLSAGGELCMRSTQPTHVVLDVTGWWS
ncbi:MAG: CAP domain-containing protein [Ilumatobacteraceae bacterium]